MVRPAQRHAAARRNVPAQPVERGPDRQLDLLALLRTGLGARHQQRDPARVDEALVHQRPRRLVALRLVVEQVHQQPALAAALELAQPPLAVQHLGGGARGRLRLLDLLLAQRLIGVDDEQEAQQHVVRPQRDAQPRPRADPLVGGQPHRALRLFDAERERPLGRVVGDPALEDRLQSRRIRLAEVRAVHDPADLPVVDRDVAPDVSRQRVDDRLQRTGRSHAHIVSAWAAIGKRPQRGEAGHELRRSVGALDLSSLARAAFAATDETGAASPPSVYWCRTSTQQWAGRGRRTAGSRPFRASRSVAQSWCTRGAMKWREGVRRVSPHADSSRVPIAGGGCARAIAWSTT